MKRVRRKAAIVRDNMATKSHLQGSGASPRIRPATSCMAAYHRPFICTRKPLSDADEGLREAWCLACGALSRLRSAACEWCSALRCGHRRSANRPTLETTDKQVAFRATFVANFRLIAQSTRGLAAEILRANCTKRCASTAQIGPHFFQASARSQCSRGRDSVWNPARSAALVKSAR